MTWLWALLPVVFFASIVLHVHATARRPAELPPSPMPAVVLGARVWPDGTPSDALRDRVATGVGLLNAGHATRLVLSGGAPDQRPTEASVMARIAGQLGARELQLEAASTSTVDNARCCAALLPERAVILVTCDFHLARAAACFRAEGFTVWLAGSQRSLRPVDRWRVTLKEAVALLARPRLLWALRKPRSV